MTAARPPFPAGWTSIDLTLDELSLRNTLPVGQTFIWHRIPLPPTTRPSSSIPCSPSSSGLGLDHTISRTGGIDGEDMVFRVKHRVKLEPEPETSLTPTCPQVNVKVEQPQTGYTSATDEIQEKPMDGFITIQQGEPGPGSGAESGMDLDRGTRVNLGVHEREDGIGFVPEKKVDIDIGVKLESESKLESKPEPDRKEEEEDAADDDDPDEPLEEYSRVIPDPDRVVLLRQTPSKIWITSVLPSTSTSTTVTATTSSPGSISADGSISYDEERRARDRAWFMDYFQLPMMLPFIPPLSATVVTTTATPTVSTIPIDQATETPSRPRPRPLELKSQYRHWKDLDPLLFGKAYDRDELPVGVRVVRQEGWECLISFITSSANNVPRITSLLHKLQAHYSPVLLSLPHPELDPLTTTAIPIGPDEQPLEVEPGEIEYRSFPPPSALISDPHLDQTLRALGFGYRAGFIVSSLGLLVAEHGSPDLGEGSEGGTRTTRGVKAFLEGLRREGEDQEQGMDWRTELIRLKGVGRKVADCIGLMSMDKPNVVPIDTHLQQIAARHPSFPSKLKHKSTSSEPVYNQVQEFLTRLWGGPSESINLPGNGFAGWAQAVMFAADLKGSTAVESSKNKMTANGAGKKRKASDEGREGKGGKSIKFDKHALKTEQGSSAGSSKAKETAVAAKEFAHPSKVKALRMLPALEQQLTSTEYDPNPLIPLLSLARHPEPEVVHKAIWALYRVFAKLIAEDRLQGLGLLPFDRTRTNEVKDQSKIVRRWMEERLYDYADILAGCLRDREPSLRKSGSSLIFSLLPPLSENLSNHIGRPQIATAYLAYVLNALVLSTVSLRGSRPTGKSSVGKAVNNSTGLWETVDENQATMEDNELPADVVHDAGKKLADYDDLRWAVFKGFSTMIESYSTGSFPVGMSGNILSLILPLNNLPQNADDINEFYFPHLSKKPAKNSSKKVKTVAKPGKNAENAQSWMDFFDSSDEESSSEEEVEIEVDKKTGVKRKRVKKQKVKKDVHNLVWSVVSQKKVFTDCWLGVLAMPLTQPETRSILLVLHSVLFPNLIRGRVVRITDWLGGLCDQGGPLALLSLNGLFILMSKYNLEYPHFYRRLYGFMDREVLHVKHRARFFRLTETFLRSPLLPASLVASFVKRLARLSLSAPPSSAVMTIPFIYNMLKRHPSCMGMLHRPTAVIAPSGAEDGDENDSDPFDADEKDPLKTGALDSSLWELKSLQKHYLSHVSTMGKIFEEVFTKPEFNLDDFLDHTYATLFETEVKRRLKNPPALAMDKTSNPFPLLKDEAPENSDVINELFTFSK